MIARILLAAIAAGLFAGAFVSVAQMAKVTPLIYAAEVFENAEPAAHDHAPGTSAHDHGTPAQAAVEHDHGDGWAPEDGIERIAYTTLANIVIGAGFGLLLAAGMTLIGRVANWRNGLIWGACGYMAFSLLPALGLPPELPGMAAADLAPRQIWWVLTAAASALGIGLIIFGGKWPMLALGVVLLVAPHVVGAPHPDAFSSSVPAELAAQFVSASLVTAALFWLVLGGLTGHFIGRSAAEA